MGDRYYLTGVQLGMLRAFIELKKVKEGRDLLEEIETAQYLGTAEDSVWFNPDPEFEWLKEEKKRGGK